MPELSGRQGWIRSVRPLFHEASRSDRDHRKPKHRIADTSTPVLLAIVKLPVSEADDPHPRNVLPTAKFDRVLYPGADRQRPRRIGSNTKPVPAIGDHARTGRSRRTRSSSRPPERPAHRSIPAPRPGNSAPEGDCSTPSTSPDGEIGNSITVATPGRGTTTIALGRRRQIRIAQRGFVNRQPGSEYRVAARPRSRARSRR